MTSPLLLMIPRSADEIMCKSSSRNNMHGEEGDEHKDIEASSSTTSSPSELKASQAHASALLSCALSFSLARPDNSQTTPSNSHMPKEGGNETKDQQFDKLVGHEEVGSAEMQEGSCRENQSGRQPQTGSSSSPFSSHLSGGASCSKVVVGTTAMLPDSTTAQGDGIPVFHAEKTSDRPGEMASSMDRFFTFDPKGGKQKGGNQGHRPAEGSAPKAAEEDELSSKRLHIAPSRDTLLPHRKTVERTAATATYLQRSHPPSFLPSCGSKRIGSPLDRDEADDDEGGGAEMAKRCKRIQYAISALTNPDRRETKRMILAGVADAKQRRQRQALARLMDGGRSSAHRTTSTHGPLPIPLPSTPSHLPTPTSSTSRKRRWQTSATAASSTQRTSVAGAGGKSGAGVAGDDGGPTTSVCAPRMHPPLIVPTSSSLSSSPWLKTGRIEASSTSSLPLKSPFLFSDGKKTSSHLLRQKSAPSLSTGSPPSWAIARPPLGGKDGGICPVSSSIRSCTKKQQEKKKKFPEKLMFLLSQEETRPAIVWSPQGDSFSIVNPRRLVSEVLPKYLKQSKFESFARKLKRWGFKRTGAMEFKHELFKQNDPELCQRMTAHPNKAQPHSSLGPATETLRKDFPPGAIGARTSTASQFDLQDRRQELMKCYNTEGLRHGNSSTASTERRSMSKTGPQDDAGSQRQQWAQPDWTVANTKMPVKMSTMPPTKAHAYSSVRQVFDKVQHELHAKKLQESISASLLSRQMANASAGHTQTTSSCDEIASLYASCLSREHEAAMQRLKEEIPQERSGHEKQETSSAELVSLLRYATSPGTTSSLIDRSNLQRFLHTSGESTISHQADTNLDLDWLLKLVRDNTRKATSEVKVPGKK